ncbi:MAG: hypothetical protein MZV65_17105 [Chromatiales bacterium]|nr:hypothetical protein [Chromatiales bacterium]
MKWLETEYGFNRWDAYELLGQVAEMTVANVVDPNYTVVAKFPKKYLPPKVANEVAAGDRFDDPRVFPGQAAFRTWLESITPTPGALGGLLQQGLRQARDDLPGSRGRGAVLGVDRRREEEGGRRALHEPLLRRGRP